MVFTVPRHFVYTRNKLYQLHYIPLLFKDLHQTYCHLQLSEFLTHTAILDIQISKQKGISPDPQTCPC